MNCSCAQSITLEIFCQKCYTGIPTFWKFAFCHFTFTKDLHWYLFSLTETSEEDFYFCEKRWKAKARSHTCLAGSCCRGIAQPRQWEWHHRSPSLETSFSTSAASPIAIFFLNCHLDFIKIFVFFIVDIIADIPHFSPLCPHPPSPNPLHWSSPQCCLCPWSVHIW